MLDILTSAQLTGFILASIVIILAPGPDCLFLINQSLQKGRYHALLSAWGLSLGNLFHTILAATGLSTMIFASPLIFNVIRILGIGYLLFLAYRTIFVTGIKKNNLANKYFHQQPLLNHRYAAFLQGLAMNMVNIKVAIFFVAYLPQFVVLSEPHSTAAIGMQIFFLGLIFTFLVVIIFSAIGLLAGSLIHIIHFDIQQSLFLRWCFGSVYILIALKLLL